MTSTYTARPGPRLAAGPGAELDGGTGTGVAGQGTPDDDVRASAAAIRDRAADGWFPGVPTPTIPA